MSKWRALCRDIRRGCLVKLSGRVYAVSMEDVSLSSVNEAGPIRNLSEVSGMEGACVILCFPDGMAPDVVGGEVIVYFLPSSDHVDFVICRGDDFLWVTRLTDSPDGVVAEELNTHEALDVRGDKRGRWLMETLQHVAVGVLRMVDSGEVDVKSAWPGAHRVFPGSGLRVANSSNLVIRVVCNKDADGFDFMKWVTLTGTPGQPS